MSAEIELVPFLKGSWSFYERERCTYLAHVIHTGRNSPKTRVS